MSNPNPSPENQFQPGESGNPEGRPKGSISLKTIIQQRIAEIPIGQTKNWAEQIIESLLEKAVVNKDVAAQKLIFSYVDGNPDQALDLTSKGEKLKGIDREALVEAAMLYANSLKGRKIS